LGVGDVVSGVFPGADAAGGTDVGPAVFAVGGRLVLGAVA
jgi:hypothetical protein